MQTELEAAIIASSSPGDQVVRRNRRHQQEQAGDRMKKYTKLILAVIAVISSLSFIIYKYRYDRLYHVMQVLEVFGSPDQGADVSGCQVKSPVSPVWQSVSPGVWIYSAHCSAGSSCSSVTAVGVMNTTADLQCHLWYEGAAHTLQGILQVSTNNAVTIFTCESKYPDKTPYAIAISRNKDSLLPVQISPAQSSSNSSQSSLINVCITPEVSGGGDLVKSLQNSLIFHSFVGVSSIRLYSRAVSQSVMQTIQSLLSSSNTSVQILSWNLPHDVDSAVTSQIISHDCYYSSRLSFQFYSVLNSYQVFMPTQTGKLGDAFLSLEHSLQKGPNKVGVKKYCSEYPTEKKAKGLSIPIPMLESSWYNKQLSEDEEISLVKLSDDKEPVKDDKVLTEELSLNEYRACDKYDFSETDENSVYQNFALKFSTDLISYYRKLL